VILAKDLNSELLKLVQISVQTFVDNHHGRLPESAEWNQIIEINNLMDVQNGPLRKVNNIHRDRLYKEMRAQAEITNAMRDAVKAKFKELMQYEFFMPKTMRGSLQMS
jgi:hypothetical protein